MATHIRQSPTMARCGVERPPSSISLQHYQQMQAGEIPQLSACVVICPQCVDRLF